VDIVLRNLLDRFENVGPWFGRLLGNRPDIQLSAFGVSILTHAAFLVTFAMIGFAANSEIHKEFKTELIDTSLTDFAEMEKTELASIDQTEMVPVAGSFAPSVTAKIIEVPTEPIKPPPLSKMDIALAASTPLPGAPRLDSSVQIKGNGAEHVGSVEGAVDRVAVEILRRLEKGRTHVVWAFDASGSLQAERERLAKYIDGVYHHITQMDKDSIVSNGGLLTSVVAFGKERKILTREPTADRSEIVSAIDSVPLDETGFESTFRTVGEIARKYGKLKKDGEVFRTMIVVVTDEVGDDEELLEDAIALCTANKVPVYILGNAALFGRADGYMNYTDPKTKQVYYNLPVRQGPESVVAEGIKLGFWYSGPQYDFMDAGFGPYALSRLAGATGGIYFVTRMGGGRILFDPAGMREYRPDWMSKAQYMASVNRHPVRLAVMRAAQITQENMANQPNQPSMSFPAADSPQFKDEMAKNQVTVARIQYTVDEALGVGQPANVATIASTVKKRDHETSRRWQAHYDLIRGRLLAMKLRCYEYNYACAKMKKNPEKFKNPNSNAWRLVPDTEMSSKSAAKIAEEAKVLLSRVTKEHPGTPWATLAGRELKDPFGFKWVETNVPPPPKPGPETPEAKKKKAEKTKPAPPPVVPKL
jgi:hypothetical protein